MGYDDYDTPLPPTQEERSEHSIEQEIEWLEKKFNFRILLSRLKDQIGSYNYEKLYNAWDHRHMKKLCQQLQNNTTPIQTYYGLMRTVIINNEIITIFPNYLTIKVDRKTFGALALEKLHHEIIQEKNNFSERIALQ